jgi:phosphoheptose isomerase
MCEKCVEIDERIAHYREMAELSGGDALTILSIEELVKDFEDQKRVLHAGVGGSAANSTKQSSH